MICQYLSNLSRWFWFPAWVENCSTWAVKAVDSGEWCLKTEHGAESDPGLAFRSWTGSQLLHLWNGFDWVIMRNMLEPSVENCAYCGWERVVVYQDNHAIATIHIPWIKDHFASAKLMSTPPPVHSKITLKVNSWAYFLEDSEKIQKRANILIKNWSLFYFWSICCHISSMIP